VKNKWIMLTVSLSTIAVAQYAAPAHAQLSNMMQNMPGMSSMTGGSSALPSVSSASPTNLAGILQYCVQNNDLGGASATSAASVKDSLLSKFTGSSSTPSSDPAYTSGSDGQLQTGSGQTSSLGGSGLKGEATKQVCSMVLSHAKSLI
jgi:hypothetical protein